MKTVIGIIPAYKPDYKLTELVRTVCEKKFLHQLIIVDDGTGFSEIFDPLEQNPMVRVLHLGVNVGMGGAIKYGLQYALYHNPGAEGFVCFDADGQHLPRDVERVVDAFIEHPDCTILGVRDFHSSELQIPLRSRLGNRLTELVFHIFTGIKLCDTQTGLRCYPRSVAERLVGILRNRYEFQLEALLGAAEHGKLMQVPIQTVYEDGNRRSHFNPILDSLRIYMVFVRFIGASLFCSVLDYVLFALCYILSEKMLASLIAARIVSVSVNFLLNRIKVFRSHAAMVRQMVQFAFLAIVLCAGSYWGIYYTKQMWNWNPLFAKIVVEVLLFILSFLVQRLWVFRRESSAADHI